MSKYITRGYPAEVFIITDLGLPNLRGLMVIEIEMSIRKLGYWCDVANYEMLISVETLERTRRGEGRCVNGQGTGRLVSGILFSKGTEPHHNLIGH